MSYSKSGIATEIRHKLTAHAEDDSISIPRLMAEEAARYLTGKPEREPTTSTTDRDLIHLGRLLLADDERPMFGNTVALRLAKERIFDLARNMAMESKHAVESTPEAKEGKRHVEKADRIGMASTKHDKANFTKPEQVPGTVERG